MLYSIHYTDKPSPSPPFTTLMHKKTMDIRTIDREENRRRMKNGELYHAFTPDLIADRKRCQAACTRFNNAGDVSRRTLVGMWKE